MPRLYDVTLQGVARTPYALGLVAGGIILRVVVQPLLGFHAFGETAVPLGQLLLALSAALELAGVLMLGSMLRRTTRAAKPLTARSPAYAIGLFQRIASISLFLAFLVNALGVWTAIMQGKTTVAPSFENLLITLVLYGLVVPMAIVFSTRTLPLFMRLAPPPRDSLRPLALVYGTGLVLVLLPSLFAILESMPLPLNLSQTTNELLDVTRNLLWGIGSLVLNLAILAFLW